MLNGLQNSQGPDALLITRSSVRKRSHLLASADATRTESKSQNLKRWWMASPSRLVVATSGAVHEGRHGLEVCTQKVGPDMLQLPDDIVGELVEDLRTDNHRVAVGQDLNRIRLPFPFFRAWLGPLRKETRSCRRNRRSA